MLTVTHLIGARNGRKLWGPLNFHVAAGAAWHVVGANGAGKTTLLRTLVGLRPPAAGQVSPAPSCWWLGHAQPWAVELDAAHNLRWSLDLARAPSDAARVRAALQDLQLPLNRPVRSFSAGQRRKLGLAQLGCEDRPLWVLDEPLDVLDAAGGRWLAARVAGQLARGGAVVFTSHQALPPGFPAVEQLVLGLQGPEGEA